MHNLCWSFLWDFCLVNVGPKKYLSNMCGLYKICFIKRKKFAKLKVSILSYNLFYKDNFYLKFFLGNAKLSILFPKSALWPLRSSSRDVRLYLVSCPLPIWFFSAHGSFQSIIKSIIQSIIKSIIKSIKSRFFWYRCNYLHLSRDSVSPVCGIF